MKVVEGVATVDDLEGFLSTLEAIGDETGCTVQAFDARYVVDRAHLERAVELADRARDRGAAVARDRGMEVLLYAAGRRQIDRALEMGVSEGECPVVVICSAIDEGRDETDRDTGDDGDRTASGDGASAEARAAARVRDLLAPADTLGAYDDERVREFFDVSDRELAATAATLPDLVRERVALLDVEK